MPTLYYPKANAPMTASSRPGFRLRGRRPSSLSIFSGPYPQAQSDEAASQFPFPVAAMRCLCRCFSFLWFATIISTRRAHGYGYPDAAMFGGWVPIPLRIPF